MIRTDQPYTNAKREDGASAMAFLIWAVIWIAVLLALFPH
jgi:hypothetical protein